MNFEKLSQTGFIHEFIDVTDGPHSSKFCFVLGAGASKSSGIKMGQELVDIWEKELKERNAKDYENWKKELGITDENKYSYYSQYYEKRFEKRPIDGLNFLEKMMENVNPSVGYVVLSYILTNTNHNVVITTNFDHLTEDTVNYHEKTLPLIIGHESLAHYITKQISRPTIIKIHRDLLFDPKNTSKDVGILHENWEKSLDLIFSEYHPVFIGYAGNDNSLMDYLIKNGDKFIRGEWKFPYWTLYKSEKPKGKVEEFLNKSGGYCINCDGFDELLCLIGAELGYKMPDEEDFFNDAKERYCGLHKAFENIVSNKTSLNKNDSSASDSGDDTGSEQLDLALQKIISHSELNKQYFDSIKLHRQGKYEEALKIRMELVQEQPENATYHESLSTTLHKMGKYKEAEKESRKAVELEPDNAGYHNSLSITLYKMEKYKEAEDEARTAIELDPKYADCYDTLSMILIQLNKYEEAESLSRIAIELAPDNDNYRERLEIILRKKNGE